MHYLGIDAGGTFTRFVMMDSQGEIVERLTMESIHFMRVGFDGITKELNNAKLSFEQNGFDFDDIKVAIGTAGYGESKDIQEKISAAIHKVFPNALIMNDAKFAMISALNNQDGVYVISGTGSIAFRSYRGNETRRGGFGYLLGDEGSAFWIGKRILEIFTKEADGRLERTILYDLVLKKYNIKKAYDLIALANEQEDYRGWVANFSVLASKALEVPHVEQVFKQAGYELAELANSFNVTQDTNIALGGGALLKNDCIRNAMIANLDDKYHVVDNSHDVEYAAYLLLKED